MQGRKLLTGIIQTAVLKDFGKFFPWKHPSSSLFLEDWIEMQALSLWVYLNKWLQKWCFAGYYTKFSERRFSSKYAWTEAYNLKNYLTKWLAFTHWIYDLSADNIFVRYAGCHISVFHPLKVQANWFKNMLQQQ